MSAFEDVIKSDGAGSLYFDQKYGVRTVNKAIRKALKAGKIMLAPGTSAHYIKAETDYGFKACMRHRNFSIYQAR